VCGTYAAREYAVVVVWLLISCVEHMLRYLFFFKEVVVGFYESGVESGGDADVWDLVHLSSCTCYFSVSIKYNLVLRGRCSMSCVSQWAMS
jgi:hypothetical protein